MLSLLDDKHKDNELSDNLDKLEIILTNLKQQPDCKLETTHFEQLSTDINTALSQFSLDKASLGKIFQFFTILDQMQQAILEQEQDDHFRLSNYSRVLSSTFDLMSVVMHRIPDENYLRYRTKITTEPYVEKDQILNALNTALKAKLIFPSSTLLLTSGVFSPSSAAFTSAASFERQFLNKVNDCSLIDFFELSKINILQALKVLDNSTQLEPEQLTAPMLHTYHAISHAAITMRDQSYPPNIISITEQDSTQEIQYTIPLAYHALSMTIKHQVESPLINFHLEFFGEPRDRFMLIKEYITAYLALNAQSITLEPSYSEKKWHLESKFTIDGLDPNALENAINMINDVGRMSFFDRKLSLSHILLAALSSKQSGEALSTPLLNLISLFQASKSSFPTKEDVSLTLALLKTKDLSPLAAKKLITLINAKLAKTLHADVSVSEQLLAINQLLCGNDCDNQPGSSSSSDAPSEQMPKRPPTRPGRRR